MQIQEIIQFYFLALIWGLSAVIETLFLYYQVEYFSVEQNKLPANETGLLHGFYCRYNFYEKYETAAYQIPTDRETAVSQYAGTIHVLTRLNYHQ